MNIIKSAFQWFEDNHNMAYSFIRIFIGTALFLRGWVLFSDPAALTELARAEQEYW